MNMDDILDESCSIILTAKLFLRKLDDHEFPEPNDMHIISTHKEFCVLFTWSEGPFTTIYVNISHNQLHYTYRYIDDHDKLEENQVQWGDFVYTIPEKLMNRLKELKESKNEQT